MCGLGSATLVSRRAPIYPPAAARDRIEGWVELELRVDSDGNVVEVSVIDSNPAGVFDEGAIIAAQGWRFAGRGMDVVLTPRVLFELIE